MWVFSTHYSGSSRIRSHAPGISPRPMQRRFLETQGHGLPFVIQPVPLATQPRPSPLAASIAPLPCEVTPFLPAPYSWSLLLSKHPTDVLMSRSQFLMMKTGFPPSYVYFNIISIISHGSHSQSGVWKCFTIIIYCIFKPYPAHYLT